MTLMGTEPSIRVARFAFFPRHPTSRHRSRAHISLVFSCSLSWMSRRCRGSASVCILSRSGHLLKIMLLNSLFFILIFGILGLIVIPSSYKLILSQYYLFITTLVFILSLFLWLGFDQSTSKFQFITASLWLPIVKINLILGVDGILDSISALSLSRYRAICRLFPCMCLPDRN